VVRGGDLERGARRQEQLADSLALWNWICAASPMTHYLAAITRPMVARRPFMAILGRFR
jgi:hypothetical protein